MANRSPELRKTINMTSKKQMILGLHTASGYGSQSSAWRAPRVDPANYINFDARLRYAQAAERGKFAFLFFPDFLSEQVDLAQESFMIAIVMRSLVSVADGRG
jgi:hypothetical protein